MDGISRRIFLASTAGVLTSPVFGQQPGTTTIVVPFGPGGSTDALARLIQSGFQAKTGRQAIVENKSGGAGSIGAAQVARSKPDGSSFLVTFDSHATIPALVPNPPLDVEKDMEPVMLVGTAPYVLVCSARLAFQNIAEVIAAEKAKPGSIRYGSAGPGTIGHLSMVLLGNKTGTDMIHVPYRTAAAALTDLIGGHVDLACVSAAIVAPQVSSANLRPILQLGDKRLEVFSKAQTIVEAGYPDLQAYAWWGVFAPKGTPAALRTELAAHIRGILNVPENRRKLEETQQMTVRLSGPEDMQTFFLAQVRTWGEVVKKNNITM